MRLRPYQVEAVEECWSRADRHTNSILCLPTGLGKTVCMVRLALLCNAAKKKPALLVVHTEELVQQARAKMEDAGAWVLIEKAESRPSVMQVYSASSQRPTVVIGSIQTMRGRRLDRWPSDMYGLILIDEAHHAVAATYRSLMEKFDAPVIGVTATPMRKGLGELFELGYSMDLIDAIQEGWLVPPRFSVVQSQGWDMSRLRVSGGRDVTDGELAESFGDEALGSFCMTLYDQMLQYRPGIVFVPSVAAAHAVAAHMRAASTPVRAVAVDGKTPKLLREEHTEGLRRGDIECIVNCGVLTEGFDAPMVSFVGMARPTRSEIAYRQRIGRGLRPADGILAGCQSRDERIEAIRKSSKPECVMLDFQGVGARFDLCSPVTLLPGNLREHASDGMDCSSLSMQELYERALELKERKEREQQIEEAKRETETRESRRKAACESVKDRMNGAVAKDAVDVDYLGGMVRSGAIGNADAARYEKKRGTAGKSPATDKQIRYVYSLIKSNISHKVARELWKELPTWSRREASLEITYLKKRYGC